MIVSFGPFSFNTSGVRTPTRPSQRPLLCRGGGVIVYLSGPGWSLFLFPHGICIFMSGPKAGTNSQNASWCKWASAINSMSPAPNKGLLREVALQIQFSFYIRVTEWLIKIGKRRGLVGFVLASLSTKDVNTPSDVLKMTGNGLSDFQKSSVISFYMLLDLNLFVRW